MTPEKFTQAVEEEWLRIKDGPTTLITEEIERIKLRFPENNYQSLPVTLPVDIETFVTQAHIKPWYERNVFAHKISGYKAVTISLKALGHAPGAMTAEQMDKVADLADQAGFGEIRVSHEQNLILPDVPVTQLQYVYEELKSLGMVTPNIGLLSNIISCPGGDYCSLANARSIPVAQAIQNKFSDLDYLYDIGELDLNISGCMNACGHHHIGHIGILGVDKHGEEFYQITIGGSQAPARLGKVIGPSLKQEEIPQVIETLIGVYLQTREDNSERFVDVVERVGIEPFKTAVYQQKDAHTEVENG